MRITKIEANHFANRILISNVSDSAVIRWVTLGVREAQPSNTHPKTQTPNHPQFMLIFVYLLPTALEIMQCLY